jgi:hypothetical protein
MRNNNAAPGKYWFTGPDTTNALTLYNQVGQGQYMLDGGVVWLASSDERLKTIIEPIEAAVEKVNTLRAVIGRFNTDDIGVRRPFLIAQDVQAVLPEAVHENADGMLGLGYTDVIPLLVAAIKELTARIAVLEG